MRRPIQCASGGWKAAASSHSAKAAPREEAATPPQTPSPSPPKKAKPPHVRKPPRVPNPPRARNPPSAAPANLGKSRTGRGHARNPPQPPSAPSSMATPRSRSWKGLLQRKKTGRERLGARNPPSAAPANLGKSRTARGHSRNPPQPASAPSSLPTRRERLRAQNLLEVRKRAGSSLAPPQ